MDSENEIEILSYTPLRRKKKNKNDSINGSQLSFKKVDKEFKTESQSSSRVHPTKRKLSTSIRSSGKKNLSQCIQNSNKKILSQSLQSSQGKKSLSSRTFKYSNNTTLTNKCSENQKLKFSNFNSSTSKVNTGNKSPLSNNENNSEITQKFNMLEEDIPDIHFSQINNNQIDNDSSKHTPTNSRSSSISYVSESLLKKRPKSDDLANDEDLSQFHQPANEAAKILRNVKEAESINLSSIQANDDLRPPAKTSISKVAHWLDSSLKYLSAQKVEVTPPHHEFKTGCRSNSDEVESTVNNIIPEENLSKACIHLHFHVHSPKKTIQPTIDKFFKSTSSTRICNKKQENVVKSQSATCVSNGKEVLKTWKTLLNSGEGTSKSKPVVAETESESSTVPFIVPSTSNTCHVPREKVSCPFYKYVEDTSFVVDAFSYGVIEGVSAYFLSHFHYDHYKGLTKNFSKIIYCDQITANLVRLKIRVQDHLLRPLPLEEPRVINGVEVTLYDANHCPGSVMFIFRLTTGKTILHVGDFRAHPDMERIDDLSTRSLDVLYLDTTYLDPRYDFFSQEQILEKCVSIALSHLEMEKKTLFLVGSYTIGKERVFKAIAASIDCKIFASNEKQKILQCLQDDEINKRLTKNKFEATVHVVPMKELIPIKLKKYMDSIQPTFKTLVAIKPTGWEHNQSTGHNLDNLQPKQNGNIFSYGIPYSEHSSYVELRRFVGFVRARKIIPTVNNGSAASRKKMEDIFNKWKVEDAPSSCQFGTHRRLL